MINIVNFHPNCFKLEYIFLVHNYSINNNILVLFYLTTLVKNFLIIIIIIIMVIFKCYFSGELIALS